MTENTRLAEKSSLAPSLAVLLTCYNRREQTCECLAALHQQGTRFDVYLVDDGSTDGTTAAVNRQFPQVNVIQGSGSLFWGGGMHLAFAEALKADYDYYLWLNDDTILRPDAFADLLACHAELAAQNRANAIVVGSTQDPLTGEPTYGGAIRTRKWYSNKFEFVPSGDRLSECETMYGNCVLIPREVANVVGNIDKSFVHSLGDLDYGLRAQQQGCSVWLAPGYIGQCAQNSVSGSWVDTRLTLLERFKKVLGVKGFPLRPWTTFVRRHSGPFWFAYWGLPYVRAVIGYRDLAASPTFTEER
ncbi:MAG: glycosyltransferase family 2 protein [Phormidesmis sp. RL_2_1]|nr:glycosyltransferase family 2 protein [Phormidesmis sp. RL_2_1]